MYKKYIPYAYAQNIYEIDKQFFVKLGIKYLFLDLDNTLDSYKDKIPTSRALNFVKEVKELGIKPIVLSNNTKKRVGEYSNKLGVDFVYKVGKPFAHGINKYVKENNLSKDEILMVGDQLITDIRAANNAKIKSLYLEKLVSEDQITTRFNRIFEKPIKKYLTKHNKLNDWRNY